MFGAVAGKFIFFRPNNEPNKVTKDESKNKMPNKEISARTIAETFTTAHC